MMKLSRKQEEQPEQENDFGTPEARRQAFHVVVEQPDPEDRKTRRTRVETDMIRWYERRDYITTVQADALRRWHSDAYAAGILPSCIGNYQQSIIGGRSELSDNRIAAQSRRNNAIKFVSTIAKFGHYAAKLVDTIAVDDKAVGRWFMDHGFGSPNEAMIALDGISTALAKHYGLVK